MSSDTHSFPDLVARPTTSAPTAENAAADFKPLFCTATSAQFVLKSLQEPQVTPKEKLVADRRLLEDQRRTQEGLAAGRLEGRLRAQRELGPDLENFLETRALLSERIDQLSSTTASGIVKLAVAASRAVLDVETIIDAAGLTSVSNGLQSALRETGEAVLRLAGPDFAQLEAVAQANGKDGLGTMPGLTLDTASDVPAGAFRLQGAVLEPQKLVEQTLSALTTLLEETPPFDL